MYISNRIVSYMKNKRNSLTANRELYIEKLLNAPHYPL